MKPRTHVGGAEDPHGEMADNVPTVFISHHMLGCFCSAALLFPASEKLEFIVFYPDSDKVHGFIQRMKRDDFTSAELNLFSFNGFMSHEGRADVLIYSLLSAVSDLAACLSIELTS